MLQVSLITVGGLVLYGLARHYLLPKPALAITASYFGSGAVIAPALGEFYEQCQIPLLAFGLLLMLEKHCWLPFWLLTVLILGIREDAGFILFGIGLYLIVNRCYVRLGVVLCLLSFSYVTIVTNWVMPYFSADSSRLYLASHFKSIVGNNPHPTTLEIFWGILTHPAILFGNLFHLPGDRAFFLLALWTPLAFIPVFSGAAWLLVSVPLLSMLMHDTMIATDMGIRYSLAIIPGLFYGAILWWSAHPNVFKSWVRWFWIGCVGLSVSLTVYANPNQAFYSLSSRSFKAPISFVQAWDHVRKVNHILNQIPPTASVSATNYLVPQLPARREMSRLPLVSMQNDLGEVTEAEYLVADVWRLSHEKRRQRGEYARLEKTVLFLDQVISASTYGLIDISDGSVLLKSTHPQNQKRLMLGQRYDGSYRL